MPKKDKEQYRQLTLYIKRGSLLEEQLLADAARQGVQQLPTLARTRLSQFYGVDGIDGPAPTHIERHAEQQRDSLPASVAVRADAADAEWM